MNVTEFLASSEKVSGIVTRLKSSPTDLMSKAPEIQFETIEGQKVVYQMRVYSRPPDYKVGEAVTVFYDDSGDKIRAKVDGFFSLWGMPTVLLLISVGFSFLGGIFCYLIRNN